MTDVGRLSGAKRTIDADGLVVMPGIIDVHSGATGMALDGTLYSEW